ncbi:MAG: hypothetical protein Roseis2KO_04320 [Roseivirga sp.]
MDAFCYDGPGPFPITNFMEILGVDSEPLQGMQIIISEGYDATTDLLQYESGNGVTGVFDTTTGILTLTGNADIATYREVIKRVLFSTSAARENATRSITVSLSNLDFLPENGHFYQYFPQTGILWTPARDAAATKQLFGLTGYLATITTQAESDFIIERVAGSAWIGGTDEANEGDWRWVTGPEGLENGGAGRPITGFTNWNDSEPNNCCGGEDFAHMMDWTSPPGRWNDLSNTSAPAGSPYQPTGYMVEYGGMPGDPDVLANINGTTVLEMIPEITIAGSISVCPNIMGVPYSTENLAGYTYEWTISGGAIASGQGTSEITVNWGDTNPAANVAVRVISNITCEVTADFPVKINEQLEPPLPVGPSTVCFADQPTLQTYTTPATPGSDYQWHVTGGTIQSGQGTNEVEIRWDGPGAGELYFTESTSTATDICDGDSPLLTIDLRPETVPEFIITQVSCFNGSDGAINLTNYTGATPFTLTWNSGGLGSPGTNNLSGLPAGNYSVDIDANGCIINVPFSITEPTELTGTMEAFDALCFGESTGRATANVTGGTGSYRYVWSNGTSGTDNTLTGLAMGSYSVDVLDENDCVLTLNFVISEPPLLVIDEILSTLVSCPEGSDGTLEAIVSGGTAPYSYSWETSQDQTTLATGFPRGSYQVTVTDANGCIVTGTQEVEEATPKIYLPTAFSPNGDGTNDTFGPSTFCPFDFRMIVYNKWGSPVFSTRSTGNRWSGTLGGKDAPIGKYTYIAAWSIEVNGELISEERKGVIRLVR